MHLRSAAPAQPGGGACSTSQCRDRAGIEPMPHSHACSPSLTRACDEQAHAPAPAALMHQAMTPSLSSYCRCCSASCSAGWETRYLPYRTPSPLASVTSRRAYSGLASSGPLMLPGIRLVKGFVKIGGAFMRCCKVGRHVQGNSTGRQGQGHTTQNIGH